MDWSASHSAYVACAFGVSALALAGLTLWVILRDRRLHQKVRDGEP